MSTRPRTVDSIEAIATSAFGTMIRFQRLQTPRRHSTRDFRGQRPRDVAHVAQLPGERSGAKSPSGDDPMAENADGLRLLKADFRGPCRSTHERVPGIARPSHKVARRLKLGPRVCAIRAQGDATRTDRGRRRATAPDVRGGEALCGVRAPCARTCDPSRCSTAIAADYALRVDFVARFARLGAALVVARDLAARDFAARG